MHINLTVQRRHDGYYVTAEGVPGLRMWHRTPDTIARLLPARAKSLLKSNHQLDAEVSLEVPRGKTPAEALLDTQPHLIVTP